MEVIVILDYTKLPSVPWCCWFGNRNAKSCYKNGTWSKLTCYLSETNIESSGHSFSSKLNCSMFYTCTSNGTVAKSCADTVLYTRLVGSGFTALLAQKGYIVPRIIQNLWYKLNFFNEWNQGFWGDNLKNIRKIRVLVKFLSNGLIMEAVC